MLAHHHHHTRNTNTTTTTYHNLPPPTIATVAAATAFSHTDALTNLQVGTVEAGVELRQLVNASLALGQAVAASSSGQAPAGIAARDGVLARAGRCRPCYAHGGEGGIQLITQPEYAQKMANPLDGV